MWISRRVISLRKRILRHGSQKKKKKKAIRFHLPCGLETAGDRKGAVGDMKICGGDNGLG